MIIVRFQGGLGNQISQYAFYRLLQYHYPEAAVKADLEFYVYNHDHQGYELDKVFNGIKLVEASFKDVLRTTGKLSLSVFPEGNCWRRIINLVNHFFPAKTKYRLSQNIVTKYPEEDIYWNLDVGKDWYLDGYWHSYDYGNIMNQLREELNFIRLTDPENTGCEERITRDKNSVSVHIRRGDYEGSIYDILGVDYYKRAVQMIDSRVSEARYYLFSDDIETAERLWEEISCGQKAEYITWNTGKNSYYDMYLMSLCRHNIIANSTFSYWAAQLNRNKDKIVIRPKMQTVEREAWDVKGWLKI